MEEIALEHVLFDKRISHREYHKTFENADIEFRKEIKKYIYI